MGISRRIAQLPRDLEIGRTWCFLAHKRGSRILTECCCGHGKPSHTRGLRKCNVAGCRCASFNPYKPAIFMAFKIECVEKVVTEDVTDEEVERLEKRGIEAVIVHRKEETIQ